MKTILAPVDFSSATDLVVSQAATLAHALGARVVLLHVIPLPVVVANYSWLIDPMELTAPDARKAIRQLEALREQLKNQDIQSEIVDVTGEPVSLILAQAEKEGADYIVMGSRGHSSLYELVVGSTTHGVLMGSRCPVVIVPTPKPALKPRRSEELSRVFS